MDINELVFGDLLKPGLKRREVFQRRIRQAGPSGGVDLLDHILGFKLGFFERLAHVLGNCRAKRSKTGYQQGVHGRDLAGLDLGHQFSESDVIHRADPSQSPEKNAGTPEKKRGNRFPDNSLPKVSEKHHPEGEKIRFPR